VDIKPETQLPSLNYPHPHLPGEPEFYFEGEGNASRKWWTEEYYY